MALTLLGANLARPQAPASLAGAALSGQVTNGTGALASFGYFLLLPADSGSNYTSMGLCGLSDQTGSYAYTPSGPVGTLNFASLEGVGIGSFDFLASTSGAFSQTNDAGSQAGAFGVVNGAAPATLSGVSLSLVPQHAALPFAPSGTALLKTDSSGTTYTLDTTAGPVRSHHAGAYSYAVLNHSTGALQMSDPLLGTNTLFLSFADTLNGTYAIRQPAFGGFQVGTFHLWALTQPWTLWCQNTNSAIEAWEMNGTNSLVRTPLTPALAGTGWRIAATADFNHDGQEDLLFESAGGSLAVWLMNGSNKVASSYLTPNRVDPNWQIACTGDMNGDGQKDILWQHSDGSLAVWLMDGLTATQSVHLNPASASVGWRLVGAADFNGDGQTDLLWQNADGRLSVWFMNGLNRMAAAALNPAQVQPGWTVAGTQDFNGDGYPGILWYNSLSGLVSYWQMDGTNCVHSGQLNPASLTAGWRVAGPR
ncbi:MAG TPA: VCBS repeat-containing protein [Verrucomicrobiae bacterium]|nr:VCBS repeat-containing protein [Verrucomicrobiae bacterium]